MNNSYQLNNELKADARKELQLAIEKYAQFFKDEDDCEFDNDVCKYFLEYEVQDFLNNNKIK